jgi:hypothetical protein
VLADLAWAITDGGEAVSDFRVVGDQGELSGLAASVPTVWRMLSEVTAGGTRAGGRIAAAVNTPAGAAHQSSSVTATGPLYREGARSSARTPGWVHDRTTTCVICFRACGGGQREQQGLAAGPVRVACTRAARHMPSLPLADRL